MAYHLMNGITVGVVGNELDEVESTLASVLDKVHDAAEEIAKAMEANLPRGTHIIIT